MAGEGDGDAAVFVLGMITGAGFAHNFGLAARPDAMVDGVLQVGGLSPYGMGSVVLGLGFCVAIGFAMRERVRSKEDVTWPSASMPAGSRARSQ